MSNSSVVGSMSAHRERPHFGVNHQRGGTTEEKSAAMETYFSYAGRYSLEDERVIHHITISSFPNWVGADQWRTATLEGDRLTLRTPPVDRDGGPQQSTLVWERVH